MKKDKKLLLNRYVEIIKFQLNLPQIALAKNLIKYDNFIFEQFALLD